MDCFLKHVTMDCFLKQSASVLLTFESCKFTGQRFAIINYSMHSATTQIVDRLCELAGAP